MLDGQFVNQLAALMTPQMKEIKGLPYVITNGGAKLVPSAKIQLLEVFSLLPFIAAVMEAKNLKADIQVIVNVEDYNKVVAYDAVYLEDGQRNKIVEADFDGVFEKFSSNTRYSQEDFITRLQSLFAVNMDREDMLKLVGSVKSDAENVSTDDGVTQNVQVKAGVHLSKEVKVRNPWGLLPYKTFPEIDPVEVPYVLRVSKGGRDQTEFALFESDGGRWKVKTTEAIRAYLKTHLKAEHVTVL